MTSSDDWRKQYDAVNQLRVLNKFHKEFLSTRLSQDTIGIFIKAQVDNLRSNLSKNALLLVQEVFSDVRGNEIAGFIRLVVPTVLIKTDFEKNFIAQEAKKIMTCVSNDCPYSESIDVLVEGCQTKNGILAESAIGYLAVLVKLMEPGYYLECGESVRGLLKQMNMEIDGKRMKMKKTAERICKDIKNKVGQEQIQIILSNVFP